MSREERKMAQIIASIERMEQETRASGDDVSKTQEQHDLARQGGRGKKGKKGKASGVKTKPGKKFKVTAVAVGAGAKAPFERKLTPKKRWIQLWSAQMDMTKDSSSSEGPEEPTEEENVEMEPTVPTIPSSPVSDAQRIPAVSSVTIAEKEEMLKITEDALPVPKASLPA
ncbi:hypothetical protein PHPALM_16327 [Phytophthora palmivora]|uniref:Uncharacterized protein n=1 Tax=Phytophthora palmivora TaxID=4796 RepID=A0A2P4XQ34_9STRA|nr:hypothetical protein PHPALM_16327 [Phytophthora palmivora]